MTAWRVAPGTQTGWHRHEFAYAAAPMKLELER